MLRAEHLEMMSAFIQICQNDGVIVVVRANGKRPMGGTVVIGTLDLSN